MNEKICFRGIIAYSEYESCEYIFTMFVTETIFDKIASAVTAMEVINGLYPEVKKIYIDMKGSNLEAWDYEKLGDNNLRDIIEEDELNVWFMTDEMHSKLWECKYEDVLTLSLVVTKDGSFYFEGCMNYTYTLFQTASISLDEFKEVVSPDTI